MNYLALSFSQFAVAKGFSYFPYHIRSVALPRYDVRGIMTMEEALQKQPQPTLGIYIRKATTLLQSEIRTGSSHPRSPYVDFTLQYISLSPYSDLYQRTCDLLRDVLHTTGRHSYTSYHLQHDMTNLCSHSRASSKLIPFCWDLLRTNACVDDLTKAVHVGRR